MAEQSLPEYILTKYHFIQRRITRTATERNGDPPEYKTIMNREGIWLLRIHTLLYLLYDTNDGFVTLMQTHDDKKYTSGNKKGPDSEIREFITLPKPIRTEEDLSLLLSAITY